MNVVNFKEYKESLKKIEYTSPPKAGLNLYKKNLEEKIVFFNERIESYLEDPIMEKCVFSKDGCAVKFSTFDKVTDVILILQDYSPEEFDTHYCTWEFYIHNRTHDEYLDSRFFSGTDMAIKYFLSKIKYMT